MSPPDGHARPAAGHGGDGGKENGGDEVEISENLVTSQDPSLPGFETRNIFGTHAQRHWDAGLPVIPLIKWDAPISDWVKSPGKQPAVRGWQQYGERMPTAEEQASWLAGCADGNMGLPLGPQSGLVAFDVDTTDGKILEILEGFMVIKSPWRRIGAKGYVVVYRYSGEKTFRIKDMDGNTICELLSLGTQVVLPPSVHPKTKAPYHVVGDVDLIEAMGGGGIPMLPPDFERNLRAVLGTKGVKLSAGGSAGLTEMVPRSSRDDECTRKAGLFAYAVLRGERTLREALGMIQEWASSFTEQVAGDNLTPDEGIRKLIRFLVKNVRENGKVLPKGWDTGLSAVDKVALGIDFDADEQSHTYSRIVDLFEIEVTAAEGDEQRLEAIQKTLVRVHRSPSLTPPMVESILRTCLKKSGLGLSLVSLKTQLKNLQKPSCPAPQDDEGIITTDMAAGKNFAEIYCTRHRHGGGEDWHWTGSRWVVDRDGAALRAVEEYVKDMEVKARNVDSEDQRNLRLESALSFQSDRKLTSIANIARRQLPYILNVAALDADKMLLGVANGVVDLETGMLRPSTQADMISMQAGVVFDPEARSPLWERFLLEALKGDAAMVAYIQRAVGYTLTGRTGEQAFFLLVGPGRNGKGVLIETLRALLDDYACAVSKRVILETGREGGGPTPEKVRLRGSRLATYSENKKGAVFQTDTIKSLTGEDKQEGRLCYGNQVEFTPTLKLFLATNDLPSFDGSDEAFVRRIHLWNFDHVVPEDKIDLELKDKLLAELSGILNWAIRGCLDWQRQGLTPPQPGFLKLQPSMGEGWTGRGAFSKIAARSGRVSRFEGPFCTRPTGRGRSIRVGLSQ